MMTSFGILCLVAVMSISISETTQVTEVRNITLMLKKILEIPKCNRENRVRNPERVSFCDIKLKIKESVSGLELPSIRLQNDAPEFSDTSNLVGTHISMKIRKGVKMNLTIQVFDYDQHNYNADRLLITISAKVDLEKNDSIQYRACGPSDACTQLTGRSLERSTSSDFKDIVKGDKPGLLIEFTIQSNAVADVLPEVDVSETKPLYEGTLKLNFISGKLSSGATYLFTISDKNNDGGSELVANRFVFKRKWKHTFEAIYCEEFVSRSESTTLTIKIKKIDSKEKEVSGEIGIQFNDMDTTKEIKKEKDNTETFGYIQTRGISNRKIDKCDTYTADFTLKSYFIVSNDHRTDADPWIRVTATSTSTGTRTIFESHFYRENRGRIGKEEKALFKNKKLTGFPEKELDNVTIRFYVAEDDSENERYMPFFIEFQSGDWKMDSKYYSKVITMPNFKHSGGKCVKPPNNDYDLCSLLSFVKESCTTTSTTTTSTSTTTTTTTPTTTSTTTSTPKSTSTSTKKPTTTTVTTTSTTTTAAEVNEDVVESGSSGGTTAGIVISILLVIAIVAGFIYYRHRSNKVEPVKVEDALPKDAPTEKTQTVNENAPILKSSSKMKIEPSKSTLEFEVNFSP